MLNRIKECADVSSATPQPNSDESSERERQERAQARKERILASSKNRASMLSELDEEDLARDNAVMQRAKHALDEQLEEVRKINQMIALAKVQAVLEEQREEKLRVQREREAEVAKVESEMEAERVKALELLEARERERVEALRAGALVVVEQMKEVDKRKMSAEQLRERERLFIEKQIEQERLHQEQRELQLRKKQKEHLDEIVAANEAVTRTKLAAKEAEKLEDQKLLEFQQRRHMEAQAREEALAAEAARREAELTKLRSMHERANDKAAELDALRAKRAMEAAERAARLKEKQERERQQRINASLADARRVQHAEKESKKAEQARFDKEESERLKNLYKLETEGERARASIAQGKLKQHSSELKHQMEAKREKVAQQRQDFLEEGNLVRSQLHAEQRRMMEIRKAKLKELVQAGVPEKHCVNIKKALVS